MAVAVEQLLGETEAQDVHVELRGLRYLLGGDEEMVHARRGDALEAHRHRVRVDLVEHATHLGHLVDQLHLVSRRCLEADRFALADRLAPAHPAHRVAVRLDAVLQLGEVVLALDLEREAIDADPGVVAHRQRVVVLLVPTLEEDSVAGALHLEHAHHLGVVRRREVEVGHGDVDMTETEDSHAATLLRPFPSVGRCPA